MKSNTSQTPTQDSTKLCKDCQTQIPAKAKKCPNCRSDQRNWFQKHPVITVLLALIVLPMFLGAVQEPDTSNSGNSTSTASSTPKNDERKDPYDMDARASYSLSGMTIINKEKKDWGNCTLTLNNSYTYEAKNKYLVEAGKEVTISFGEFTRRNNTRFNIYETKPDHLRIRCDRKNGDSGVADLFFE